MRERGEHRYERNKTAMNNYLSIINLNVNGLNAQSKRHRVAEQIRKHDPPQKVKGRKKSIPNKWTGQKAGVKILISHKIYFKKKGHKKRPRRSLHNTQGKNPSRRHKYYKHIYTQHRNMQYIRKILEDFKKDMDSKTIIVGDFNTAL